MSNAYLDYKRDYEHDKERIKHPEKLKMYIIIKDGTPPGFAALAAAHASLACYDAFLWEPAMDLWFIKSFRKVICTTDEIGFEEAKKYENHKVITESSLDNQELAIAFCPRENWPKFFKSLRLYK